MTTSRSLHFATAAAVLCAAAAIGIAACGDTLGPDDEVVSREFSGAPRDNAISVGDTVRYFVTVHTASGRSMPDASVTWSSQNPAVATIDQTGLVTGVSPGQTVIVAWADGRRSASWPLVVTPPVAAVDVTPAEVRLIVGGNARLTATPLDADGTPIANLRPEWATSDSSIATVDGGGLVTGIALGTATITATIAGVEGHATVTVRNVKLQSVTAGSFHTCGLSDEGLTMCWGDNQVNQMGYSSLGQSWGLVEVPIEFPLASLDAGSGHTCGLTSEGLAVCWGAASTGQLGNGSPQAPDGPVIVSGGHVFQTVSAGGALRDFNFTPSFGSHTCAIANSGVTYCWGNNGYGQLGATSGDACEFGGGKSPVRTFACSLRPIPVEGSLLFDAVTAGAAHTCALTADGTAYCWGSNSRGQLGRVDPEDLTMTPLEVSGTRTFTSLSAGGWHTCGISQAGIAYCWGGNDEGQLGDGTTEDRFAPVPVSGGLTFTILSGGAGHTCGVAVGGAAYCWGSNGGMLGDGTSTASLEPVPVAGGLTFESVTAGRNHTCGRTVDGIVYCWGSNDKGQLGVSEPESSNTPVRVSGQQ